MLADRQKTLSKEEKIDAGFNPDHNTIVFFLDKVIEERCDEFDYYLEDNGYLILKREMIDVATSIYNYEVTAQLIHEVA